MINTVIFSDYSFLSQPHPVPRKSVIKTVIFSGYSVLFQIQSDPHPHPVTYIHKIIQNLYEHNSITSDLTEVEKDDYVL